MRLWRSQEPSVARQLAFDEACLKRLDGEPDGVEWLRLWESPAPVVVLGAFGERAAEVELEACERDGVPVLRRASGGGTVVLAPGCLCFSLVLSLPARPGLVTTALSLDWVLERACEGIGREGLVRAGVSDLTFAGRKVSGSAQRRLRRALLHQGTLLYDFDVALAERYLKTPARAPAYREGRSHARFIGELPDSAAALEAGLARSFGARDGPREEPDISQLMAERYGLEAWHRRR